MFPFYLVLVDIMCNNANILSRVLFPYRKSFQDAMQLNKNENITDLLLCDYNKFVIIQKGEECIVLSFMKMQMDIVMYWNI